MASDRQGLAAADGGYHGSGTAGGYLCYNPDSMGTLILHWSKVPVENALAFFEAGKPIPPFKFTTNQGRFQLQKGADDKVKFFEGWSAYLKEALNRFDCKSLCLFEKNAAREDVQVVLLMKNTMQIVRVESGEQWTGSVSDIHSFAVVPKDNITFKCGTLDQNLFLSKAKIEGAGYTLT